MSLDIGLHEEHGDVCATCGKGEWREDVYDGNYTHNVIPMWRLADVYDILYNTDGHTCGQYLKHLISGIKKMESNSAEFEKLNPPNGWGCYKSALEFLIQFTDVVKVYPNAIIRISK